MSPAALFFETPLQARTFLFLLCAGALSGLLLCLLRWARRSLPCSVAAACDVLFWCITASLCALALSMGGEDTLRWYAILGLLCGAALALACIRLLSWPFRHFHCAGRNPDL